MHQNCSICDKSIAEFWLHAFSYEILKNTQLGALFSVLILLPLARHGGPFCKQEHGERENQKLTCNERNALVTDKFTCCSKTKNVSISSFRVVATACNRV